MPPMQQEEILNSLCSDDKQVAEEFLNYYDIKDEMLEVYKNRISKEELESVYEKTKDEYLGR
jgi:arsenate reductase-like glutaredoxin family protein